jgi:hypothetical protein
MALTVGDIAVSVGLDDAGFTKGVADMLAGFQSAATDMVAEAKSAGDQMISALSGATGAIGDIGRVAGNLFSHNYSQSLGQVKDAVRDAFQNVANTGSLGTSLDGISKSATDTANAVGGILVPALSQLGLESAASVVETGVAFVTMAAEAIPALIEMGLQIGALIVEWAMMAFSALASAAQVALAWLIAMGPIPLIIAAVVGLVALIILNWQTIVDWTTAAFTAIWAFLQMVWNGIVTAIQAAVGFVLGIITAVWNTIVAVTTAIFTGIWGFLQGVWGAIVGAIQAAISGVLGAIGWLGQLPGMVAGWFASVFNAAVGKLGELISWLGGLPGRILGALGNLGSLLLDVGGQILEGLWNGLKNAANWVKDKIIGLIKDIIPGPIKSILGISSPSKVAAELGRWVPLGLAQGIEGTSATVARASAQLAGIVTAGIGDLSAISGPRSLTALAVGGPMPLGDGLTSGGERAALRIDNFHATPNQSPADIAAELDWMSRGGG